MTRHHDEPTIHGDTLNQKKSAELLATELASVKAPVVFGLDGDWGSGKTSYLHRVNKVLTGQNLLAPIKDLKTPTEYDHCIVVWFEAWRYQHEEAPVVALLHEIRNQFAWAARFKNGLDRTTYTAIEAGLRSIDSLGEEIAQIPGLGAVGLTQNIRDASANWKDKKLARTLPSQATRDLLNQAVSSVLGPLTKRKTRQPERAKEIEPRVIVIIDDLDRCQPLTAYKLMEGIKIFLSIPSCVFLLGINRTAIERTVAIGMRQDEGITIKEDEQNSGKELRQRAHEYLEKLCSHIQPLPQPTQRQCVNLVKLLIREAAGKTPPALHSKIASILDEVKPNLLPANPRRIKAFVNSLLLLLPNAEEKADDSLDTTQVAAILIFLASLMTFHPHLYRALADNPDFYFSITEVSNLRGSFDSLSYEQIKILKTICLPTFDSEEIDTDTQPYFARFPDPSAPDVFRVRHLLSLDLFEELSPALIKPLILQ